MFGLKKLRKELNRLNCVIDVLETENHKLRNEITQMCCGHAIGAIEFVTDSKVVGGNIKRCTHCGKVLKYYYNSLDLMEQDKKEWENIIMEKKKNEKV
jgi:hypothetical protein